MNEKQRHKTLLHYKMGNKMEGAFSNNFNAGKNNNITKVKAVREGRATIFIKLDITKQPKAIHLK